MSFELGKAVFQISVISVDMTIYHERNLKRCDIIKKEKNNRFAGILVVLFPCKFSIDLQSGNEEAQLF
jgi:hypothetical protein